MPSEETEEERWFAEHLLPHEPMLRGWLASRYPTGVDIDDVIQEAYLKVLKYRKKEPVNAPKAFLFATAQAKDGTVSQELREWRINLITNYTFQDGVLEGFSAGGAARWQDDIAIGYPTTVESSGAILPVVANPYFGPSELNFDVWLSYRRSITQNIDWKAQLNVRNAFGDDNYIPVIANPDGQYASFRNPNPKQIFLTNTFSF